MSDMPRIEDTKHEDVSLMKQALLDCGKGIVATNAKIELLTDRITDEVSNVTEQNLASVKTSLEDMFNKFRERSDLAMERFEEKTKNVVDNLDSKFDRSLNAFENRIESRAQVFADHLKASELLMGEYLDELQRRTEELEISLLEKLEKDKSHLESSMAEHANRLCDALTKLRGDFQEAEATKNKRIKMLMALGFANGILGIVILCMLLFR